MTRFDPYALDAVFAAVRGHATSGQVPFTVLAVANAEGAIRVEVATEPGREPVPLDAQCLIASITKPIVATAVLRLHQEGRFALDAPLAWWLPELATPDRRTMTAWHVLTHSTGIDDTWLERIMADGIDKADLLARLMAQPLAAPVGSRYAYATITFDVLALAIERALGVSFETLLRQTVLEPLGMTDTDWEPAPQRAAPMEVVRWEDDWRPGRRVEADHVPAMRERLVRLHLAGAGLHSTAADLVRFGRALLRGGELDGARILGPAFVNLMTREVTRDGLGRQEDRLADNHYALGWGKAGPTHPASARAFEHGGATGTRLLIDPEHDLVVVYLTGCWALPWTVSDAAITGVYGALR